MVALHYFRRLSDKKLLDCGLWCITSLNLGFGRTLVSMTPVFKVGGRGCGEKAGWDWKSIIARFHFHSSASRRRKDQN